MMGFFSLNPLTAAIRNITDFLASGLMYIETPTLTLSVGDSVSFKILTTTSGINQYLVDGVDGASSRLFGFIGSSNVVTVPLGVSVSVDERPTTDSVIVTDGILHIVKLTVTAGSFNISRLISSAANLFFYKGVASDFLFTGATLVQVGNTRAALDGVFYRIDNDWVNSLVVRNARAVDGPELVNTASIISDPISGSLQTYTIDSSTLTSGLKYLISFSVSNFVGSGTVGIATSGGLSFGAILLSANGTGEISFTASGTPVSLFTGANNQCTFNDISLKESPGAAQAFNVTAAQSKEYIEQDNGDQLGVANLITQAIWEAPAIVGSEWVFANNQWTLTGFGSVNALTLITAAGQPATSRISGVCTSVSGTLAAASSGSDNITEAGPYSFDLDKAVVTFQTFKRRVGNVSATLDKPELHRLLKVAP